MTAADAAMCQNCRRPLTGRFCAQCGQSAETLKRPFLGLIAEAIADVFDWDGRFLGTLRALYRRPGRVGRDYVEGKRVRYTPPFRMFLLVSVVFFGLMALAQIRVIALEFNVTGEGEDQNVNIEPAAFRFGTPDWPEISPETVASAEEWATGDEADPFLRLMARFTYAAVRDPDRLERDATAAAAQAILVMVAAFALLNALLHPRHRLVEHAVHALYFSAAILPVVALLVFLEVGARLAGLGMLVAILGPLVVLVSLYLFDRGFYGSSRLGAALRTLVLLLSFPVFSIIFFTTLFYLSI